MHKYLRLASTPCLALTVSLVVACGGDDDGNAASQSASVCTSNAQCAANEECVFGTTTRFSPYQPMGGDDDWDEPWPEDPGSEPPPGTDPPVDPGADPPPPSNQAPSGTCQPLAGGTGGSGGVPGTGGAPGTGGDPGTGGSPPVPQCVDNFMMGETFYKGETQFGACDNPSHPQNCAFGTWVTTPDGCFCTAACSVANLNVGDACSSDGSWVCQNVQSSSTSGGKWCVHTSMNLCQAG